MPRSPYLKVADLATLYGVHENTVRLWLREGRIKSIKTGRTYRVHRADLPGARKRRSAYQLHQS